GPRGPEEVWQVTRRRGGTPPLGFRVGGIMSRVNGHAPGLRILGIDPGLQVTGYAVVEVRPLKPHVCEAGIIRSNEGRKTTNLAPRLLSLYNSLVEVIEQLKPQVVAVEQLYSHYNHPRTAILMAHARGVIFLAAAQKELLLVSYAASRIKKTLTGHGRATK